MISISILNHPNSYVGKLLYEYPFTPYYINPIVIEKYDPGIKTSIPKKNTAKFYKNVAYYFIWND